MWFSVARLLFRIYKILRSVPTIHIYYILLWKPPQTEKGDRWCHCSPFLPCPSVRTQHKVVAQFCSALLLSFRNREWLRSEEVSGLHCNLDILLGSLVFHTGVPAPTFQNRDLSLLSGEMFSSCRDSVLTQEWSWGIHYPAFSHPGSPKPIPGKWLFLVQPKGDGTDACLASCWASWMQPILTDE